MNQSKAKKNLITTIIAIAVVMGLVVFVDYLQHKPSVNSSKVSTVSSGSSPTEPSAPTVSASYKDGNYTADSHYFVPHGYEDIQVTLTIKDNKVTDATLQNSESDPESARFQEDFAAEYKSHVVGQSVSGLNLSYIAGASDTTDGFNDALNQIRQQAQA